MGQLFGHAAEVIRGRIAPNSDVTITFSTYAIVGATAMLTGFARYRCQNGC